MSKRKFHDILEADLNDELSTKKHTLDSDEDDDEDGKNYDIMNEDDIEGQEDATVEFDGEIRITPFNLKEELEEGHFDKDGNYFLKKEEEIHDKWLDNIDWIKVKASEGKSTSGDGLKSSDDSSSDSDSQQEDHEEIFRRMLTYMQPGETVLQTIQRLGKKNSLQATASSRWKTKKKCVSKTTDEVESMQTSETKKENGDDHQSDSGNDAQKMLELTELADKMVTRGWMEIYQDTYEKLSHKVRLRDERKIDWSKAGDDDDALDMFGDNFDETIKKPTTNSNKSENLDDDHVKSGVDSVSEDCLMWEFKWENKDDAKVYGPHSSSEMQQWVADGYFDCGVWARRTNQPDSQFYTSKRIDFELYL